MHTLAWCTKCPRTSSCNGSQGEKKTILFNSWRLLSRLSHPSPKGFSALWRSMQTSLLDVHSGLRPPALHTNHPPGCLEFGPESPGPGEEQGNDCKGNQDFPGFFKSGLLISALAPMLCRVQVRKTWAKGLQSNQAWGLQPHAAHAHTRPLQHFISTCPHCCIHTPWSLPAGK